MALTTTTLSASALATDTVLAITSTASGFPAAGVSGTRQLIRVDEEYMLLDQVIGSGIARVAMRGYQGTRAVQHDKLATVATSATPSDFGQNLPTGYVAPVQAWNDAVYTIGEDLTFTASGTAVVQGTSLPIPQRDTTYYINKASAAAITLISGTAADAGRRLRFVSQTAAAHAITYTPGFLGDTTSSDVATSASKVGAVLEILCGPTGLWGTINASTTVSNWTLG